MNHLLISWALVATLLFSGTQPVAAAVVSYTDVSAFASEIAGMNFRTYDFEGIAADGGFVTLGTSPITVGGLEFSSTSRGHVLGAGLPYYHGASFFSSQFGFPTVARVSLSGAKAVGFIYGSYWQYGTADSDSYSYSATLNTGDVFKALIPPLPGTAFNLIGFKFIGFISDTDPITSITFTDLGSSQEGISSPIFDIVRFVTAPVPVPPAVWLMGSALAGLGFTHRRIAYSLPRGRSNTSG